MGVWPMVRTLRQQHEYMFFSTSRALHKEQERVASLEKQLQRYILYMQLRGNSTYSTHVRIIRPVARNELLSMSSLPLC